MFLHHDLRGQKAASQPLNFRNDDRPVKHISSLGEFANCMMPMYVAKSPTLKLDMHWVENVFVSL